MLSFDLGTLYAHAVQVDAVLTDGDPVWESEDPRSVAGVTVHGRLSSAGTGRFYFSGHFEGQVTAECRRCLAVSSANVAEEIAVVFAEADDAEVDDDPDVYHLDPKARVLDLRPALREQWLLAVPAFVECRPDCAGLCPTCGADLNAGPCSCQPAADPRWDALRSPDDQHS